MLTFSDHKGAQALCEKEKKKKSLPSFQGTDRFSSLTTSLLAQDSQILFRNADGEIKFEKHQLIQIRKKAGPERVRGWTEARERQN